MPNQPQPLLQPGPVRVIALAALGCGHGALDRADVEPLLRTRLQPLARTVYAPA